MRNKKTIKERIIIMDQNEIRKHERYKQMSLYSYDVKNNTLPNGATLIGIVEQNNGFYAAVIRDGNEIVIAYRGSDDVKDWTGSNKDMFILRQRPQQTQNALNSVDIVKSIIRENPEYAGCKITVVGHSLGGSLAQIVAVLKGVKAVTFNAYGTKHLLQNEPNLNNADVTNYCNPDDNITTFNARNHVGKCYEIGSIFVENRGPHHLETMENLENRIPTSAEELQETGERKRRAQAEIEFYRRTGRFMPIRMPSLGYHGENCAGTYRVSGYTRDDGTKVSSYTRTCGAKHLG